MRIFVTGAGGFIGSSLVGYLQELGHDVTGHVRSESGDLTHDSIPDDVGVIVNSAGRLGTPGVKSSELAISNAHLPVMLAEHCLRTGSSLVHLSTPGVAGLAADADEDMDQNPWGEYESTKAQAELELREHGIGDQGRLTILRPDFVYGPGDLHKLPFFRQVASGFLPVIGRQGARIRPTYCEDVCRAVEASLPGGCLSGGLFNIGGPGTVTVRDLGDIIARELGRKVTIVPLPGALFRLALHLGPVCPSSLSRSRLRLFGEDHFVSTEKARMAGFIPVWPLGRGIRETVSWYVREGLIQ